MGGPLNYGGVEGNGIGWSRSKAKAGHIIITVSVVSRPI